MKEWEVYVVVTRQITFPYDGESEKEMLEWLYGEGKGCALHDVIKGARITYPANVDIEYEDLYLREHDVKPSDTDPRV